MNFENEEDVLHHVDHNMTEGKKLTMVDIQQTSPDYIEIIHFSGDLRPERHFSFIVTKGDTSTYYKDDELTLSVEEWATLKTDYEVRESTLDVLPSPAAIKRAEREWDEWVKVHGGESPFRKKS